MGENEYKLNYEISETIIESRILEFNKDEKDKEETLRCLFNLYEKNECLKCVLIKVTVLNSLYSSMLNNTKQSKKVDVVLMANHIVDNKDFDSLLWSNDSEDQLRAYDYIATGIHKKTGGDYNRCFSFASKYCSWHRPDVFPIMDSNVKIALSRLISSNENDYICEMAKGVKLDDNFNEYNTFRLICKEFRDYVNSSIKDKNYTFKDLDKYLWELGKEIKDDAKGTGSLGEDTGLVEGGGFHSEIENDK